MASSDAALIQTAQDVEASLESEGLAGVTQHPDMANIIEQLHTSSAAEQQHKKLLQALHKAAEQQVTGAEEPTLAALAVMGTLARDISSGSAAPPADSAHGPLWHALVHKLQLGLIYALSNYPGPSEGKTKQDVLISAGAVAISVYPKVKSMNQPLLQLACEACLLRLLRKQKGCLEYLRGLELSEVLLDGLKEAVKAGSEELAVTMEDLQGEEEDEEEYDDEDEDSEESDEEDGDDDDDDDDDEEEEEEKKTTAKPRAGRKAAAPTRKGAAPKRAAPPPSRSAPGKNSKRMKK